MREINKPSHAFGMLKKKVETERRIHTRLCAYLRERYPNVRFITTLDGEYFGQFQAQHVRALQWGAGAPDLLIFQPNGKYYGLALELKRDTANPFKKDGKLKKNEHIQEQADWLDYLQEVGWRALFAVGYENAMDIIDEYMNLRI
jgi:hypothetical protein